MENVVNEKQAARYIGMSVSYLRQDRCYGAVGDRVPGPIFLKFGRAIRYRVCDLDAWLDQHLMSGPVVTD